MTVTEGSGAQFDFGRVTSRTAGLIQRNFVPFSVLSLIFSGAPIFLFMLLGPVFIDSDVLAGGVSGPLVSIVSFLTGLVLQGALMRASIDDLSGKSVSIGASLNAALGVLFPLLGLGIVVGVGIIAGMILLIVPGIILAVRWSVAAPVVVAERVGIFDAMGRSAKLTENNRWAIFGLMVLYAIVVWVVSIVVMLAIPGAVIGFGGGATGGALITFAVVMALLQALQSLIGTVGIAAIYFELRQIKEGVGVTEIAAVFD